MPRVPVTALPEPGRDAVSLPVPSAGRLRAGWGALLVSAVARTVLVLLVGLLLWSVAPAAAGWSSSVVMSNSMAPRMYAGDVALVRPVDPQELHVGQVLLVDDPDHPGRLRLHRLQAIDPVTGALTLKGDANAGADSTPVPSAAVHGVAALRVPAIGSPMLWLAQGRIQLVAATAAALTALAAGAFFYRPQELPGPRGPRQAASPAVLPRQETTGGLPGGAERPLWRTAPADRTDTVRLPRVSGSCPPLP